MTDFRAYARGAAGRAGIDPDLFERQIEQESGFDPAAFNPLSGARGIAQIVPAFHPGVDPSDPLASLEYAARWLADLRRQLGSYRRALAAYNWGPGRVLTWDGRRETLPEETRRYLDAILGAAWPEPEPAAGAAGPAGRLRVTDDGVRLRAGPTTESAILAELPAGALVTALGEHAWRNVQLGDGRAGWMAATYLAPEEAAPVGPGARWRFDPETPTELQVQDWTCAIRVTMWLLKSIGIPVTAEEAQDRMHPRYVSRELGLLDASGGGIVAVLREGWGVEAFNLAPVEFDPVAGYAGRCPLGIGGRAWNHWSAVRRVNAAGELVLANPAGTGPRYGQQTLNRRQFADLGWFSAVVVPVE